MLREAFHAERYFKAMRTDPLREAERLTTSLASYICAASRSVLRVHGNNTNGGFMKLHILKSMLFTVALFLAATQSALSAQISRSSDPECRIDIVGPIAVGDFNRLTVHREFLMEPGVEGTNQSIVCLDSPGGSVVDGLKIAEFFLNEGVSTRVRANKKCLSICAIMFMMGNIRAGELSQISRRIHVTSELGFHRPYIRLDDAKSFTSGTVEEIFDLGMETIFEMMTLATRPTPYGGGLMMEPSLVRTMTGTARNDMYIVKRIEELIHWKIEVDGLPKIKQPTEFNLVFACENMLVQDINLVSELARLESPITDAVFDLVPFNSQQVEIITRRAERAPENSWYTVWGTRYGEVEVWCQVGLTPDRVRACGVDGETDYALGRCGEQYGWRYQDEIVMFHPASTIDAIAKGNGADAHATKFRRCRVYVSATLALDEPCHQHVTFYRYDGGLTMKHHLDFESELSTVVTIRSDGFFANGKTVTVNGEEAEFRTGKPGQTCVGYINGLELVCLSDAIPAR